MKQEIHPTHDMTDWEHTVVTIVDIPRLGSMRFCRHCNGEHARTVVGDSMHEELMVPCWTARSIPAELVQRMNELIDGAEVDLDKPLPPDQE